MSKAIWNILKIYQERNNKFSHIIILQDLYFFLLQVTLLQDNRTNIKDDEIISVSSITKI